MHNADKLVKVESKSPGEPWTIILGGNGLPEVEVASHANKAVMDVEAAKIREFLAALLAK